MKNVLTTYHICVAVVFVVASGIFLSAYSSVHATVTVSKIVTSPDGVYANVAAGAEGVSLLSFDITPQSDTGRIRFFTIEVNGRKDDLKNLKLKEGNRVVAELSVVDSTPLTFTVSDVRIEPGQKKSYTFVSDIASSAFGNIVGVTLSGIRLFDDQQVAPEGLPLSGPEFKVTDKQTLSSPKAGNTPQQATLSGLTREPSKSQFESGEEVTLVWSVLGNQDKTKVELSISCPADMSVVAERVSCSNAKSAFDVTGRNAFTGKLIHTGTKTQKISFTVTLIVNNEKKATRTMTVSVTPEQDRPIRQFGLLGGGESVISRQRVELVWDTLPLRRGEHVFLLAQCPSKVSITKMLGLKCGTSGTGFDVTNRKRLYGIVENATQKNQTVTFVLKSVFEKKIQQKKLKVTILPTGGTLAPSLVPGSLVKSSSGSTVYYVNDDSTISAFSDSALLKA